MGHVGDFQVRVHSNNMAERVLCVLHHPLRHSRVGRIKRTGAHWDAWERRVMKWDATNFQNLRLGRNQSMRLRLRRNRPCQCCVLGRNDPPHVASWDARTRVLDYPGGYQLSTAVVSGYQYSTAVASGYQYSTAVHNSADNSMKS